VNDDDLPFDDPVILPIEDSLDLHPFQPKEIASVVEEYLEECRRAGFSEVRLIHGKGQGVQRNIIRSLLEKHPHVDSFHDAPLEAGGWGATVVILKRQN
jgi:DNA-nicking Smr family endonuclease